MTDTSTKAMEREAAMMDRSQNFVWGRKTRSLAAERDALAAQLAEAQAEVERLVDTNDQTVAERDAARAEVARLQSGAVKVKPLVFCDDYAIQPFDCGSGEYRITDFGFEWHGQKYACLSDDPVAAIKADYERRMLAAIEATSADDWLNYQPTDADLANAALSYDHGFWLLDEQEQRHMMNKAKFWLHAWQNTIRALIQKDTTDEQ